MNTLEISTESGTWQEPKPYNLESLLESIAGEYHTKEELAIFCGMLLQNRAVVTPYIQIRVLDVFTVRPGTLTLAMEIQARQ